MSGKNGSAIDRNLASFSKISTFICSLRDVIVPKGSSTNHPYHTVALYARLLEKVKVSHKQIIKRHVQLFSHFCTRNSDAILARDVSKLVSPTIIFNEKVNLPLGKVLSDPSFDSGIYNEVWNHLTVISAVVDPTSEARAYLERLQNEGSKEGAFINSFFNRIENTVGDMPGEIDPSTAANKLLQSGVMNDLVQGIGSGMQSGQLDIGKLMGTVQTLLGGITGKSDNPQDNPLGGMMNMISGLMNGLGGANNSDGSAPNIQLNDIVGMLPALTNSLGAMGMSSNSSSSNSSSSSSNTDTKKPISMNPDVIKQNIEERVEKELKQYKSTLQQEEKSFSNVNKMD